ncbi:MAG: hypothetical protein JNK82_09655 [Myxococcaceae bacterium]|nr:hypothetical protein [Myxococcaceae bacterium]
MRVWLRRLLISVAVVVALIIAAVAIAVHNLEHPLIKSRIAKATGYELDYTALKLTGLSGAHLENLVVLNPEAVRAAAREFVRLDTLDVRWTLSKLPKVEHVTAKGLTVNLVNDASGHSSLGPPAAPTPQTPLSKKVPNLLAGAPAFDEAVIEDLTYTQLSTAGAETRDRLSASGLQLTAKAQVDGAAHWKLALKLGDAVELAHNGRAATLKVALALELDKTQATLNVDIDTTKQSFAPALTLSDVLHAKLAAQFDDGRVSVTVEPSRVAGAADLEGALVLYDDPATPPQLTQGRVNAQLARLLAVLPPLPFSLADGALLLDARSVSLSAVPRVRDDGWLKLNVTATKLQQADLKAETARLEVTAAPGSTPSEASAAAVLTFEKLELGGATTVRAPSGRVELKAKGVAPAPASPLKVSGDVTLSVSAPSLSADTGSLRANVEKLALEASAPLPKQGPFALKADLPLGTLKLADAKGKRLLSAPARLQLEVTQATLAGDGSAHAVLDVGALHVGTTLDGTGGGEELVYAVKLEAPDLGLATPFLDAETAAKAPWSQLSATVESSGRVTKRSSVDHQTTVKLPRLEWEKLSARDVVLTLHSKGDALVHEGEAALTVGQLRTAERELGPQDVALTAAVDRRKLSVRAGLTVKRGPKLAFDAAVAYQPARKALKTSVKLELKDSEETGRFLNTLKLVPELDATKLATTFSFDGAVLGVVESLSASGELKTVKNPLDTLGVEGKLALDLAHFRWLQEGVTYGAPKLEWRADLGVDGAKRTVHSLIKAERLVQAQGERRLIVRDLVQDLTFAVEGKLELGALQVRQLLTVASVEQRPELPVPVKNVTFTLAADRNPGGLIRLSDVVFKSPETKTELTMKGQLDLSDGRRQLTVRGTVEQDLAGLKLPEVFEGRGGVALAFRIASPDLEVFRARSKLKLKDVHVKLPDGSADIEGLDGDVAINESVRLGEGGLELTREIDTNPYSMLRYADQHPLLSTSSFITAKRIETQYGEVAPFAGNLSIEQNVVSLSQLELGIRGGRMTGQCTLDYQGAKSTLEAHVRATGVQSSRGEPFDGNAAIVISAHDRSVNGRAEILRIGNQHLRDLLDVQDPQRIDPSINRIRSALTVGYPEHLRLVFDHGFASMRISFGGAAKLLKVDDVRGIPVGPLVSRALASVKLPE